MPHKFFNSNSLRNLLFVLLLSWFQAEGGFVEVEAFERVVFEQL